MLTWILRASLFLSIMSIVGVLLTSCSQHTRTIDGEADPQIVMDNFQESLDLLSTAAGANSVVDRLKAMAEDPNVGLYYSEGPSPLGPVESVFAVLNFDFLKLDGGLQFSDIKFGRVFFLDLKTTEGRKNMLFLHIEPYEGNPTYAIYSNYGDGFADPAQVSDGEFVTILSNSAGEQTLVLRSYDVEPDSDDLMANIQLKVSDFVDGQERPIGKFSTLMGFGQ